MKPSKKGIKKYPPDGYYEGVPCTCKDKCLYNCKGECGCKACKALYQDFLSDE